MILSNQIEVELFSNIEFIMGLLHNKEKLTKLELIRLRSSMLLIRASLGVRTNGVWQQDLMNRIEERVELYNKINPSKHSRDIDWPIQYISITKDKPL